ncbi:hypothetical protein RchiOBHm_Chr3g0485311 [Rosa chinensis]|uniref:Uncharacterized protein n=1 Tax=Rosa chinensis TaxID=74649 RepID=A0A2P6REY2_ROSCH|nr:hypothetical protein RchiOBHm_Chr3g0485311 [Rosa chinensis]
MRDRLNSTFWHWECLDDDLGIGFYYLGVWDTSLEIHLRELGEALWIYVVFRFSFAILWVTIIIASIDLPPLWRGDGITEARPPLWRWLLSL